MRRAFIIDYKTKIRRRLITNYREKFGVSNRGFYLLFRPNAIQIAILHLQMR